MKDKKKFEITYYEKDPWEPGEFWEVKTRYCTSPSTWNVEDVHEYYNEEYPDEMEVIGVEECTGGAI